jgi:tetratricopeptide (TPR) repeat protein
MVIDDIHWSDEGSLDALWQLISDSGSSPLFFLFLARPGLFERRPEWRESPGAGMEHVILPLEPLAQQDAQMLVRSILWPMEDVPVDLSTTIVGTAGGNPFYVEEIVRVLLEDGIIRRDGERWRLTTTPAELRIPSTLTGVVQARLDRLAPHEREILQRAAVVGRQFWDKAIAAVAPSPETPVQDTLSRLEAREFVVRQPSSSLPDTREYSFKHAVLREVAYESMLVQQRRSYHGAIAAWISEQGGSRADENAGLIGNHFELAGDTAAASLWYARAGEQARARYTPETAIQYYRKALAFTSQELSTLEVRVQLYAGLGETLRWQARFAEAIEALEAMRATAELAGDVTAQIYALQNLFLTHDYQGEHRLALESASAAEYLARRAGTPADLAMALSAKGWALLFLGEEEQALALGEEARERAEAAGAKRELAFANMLLGGAQRMRGDYESALAAVQRALALFRELGDRIWEGLMLYHLGQTARLQGSYAAAVKYYSQALELARTVGDYYGAMSALSRMGRMARLQGAYRQAERYYSEALRLAEKSGNTGRQAYLVYSLGELLLAQALEREANARSESLDAAGQLLTRAIQVASEAEQGVTEAAAHLGLARVHLARAMPQDALKPALAGLDLARLQIALWQGVAAQKVVGTAWWVLGQIASRLPEVKIEGESYDGERCFAESLAVWDEVGTGVAWERACTLRDWSALLFQQGETARAEALRQEATEIFARLEMVQEIDRGG